MKAILFTVLITCLSYISLQDNVEERDEVIESTEVQDIVQEEAKEVVTNLFSQEWEQKMFDYEPGYVYMIPIRPKKAEVFYEDINKVPVKVRGAFLTDESIKEKIEFLVVNPNNKLAYQNYTNECIFEFEATIPGTYQIKFRNSQSKHEIKTTFTMNTYQEEILQKEHLTFSDEKITGLNKFMDKIKFEEGMVSKKRNERKISKNNDYYYHYYHYYNYYNYCYFMYFRAYKK